MPPRKPPRTHSRIQAAIELGLPVKTIGELIAEGKLKTVTLPGQKRARITQASIDAVYAATYGETANT